MDSIDHPSVSYLDAAEGIPFDGRSYALQGKMTKRSSIFCFIKTMSNADPNFKINQSFTLNFQLKTFSADGLILWVEDPLIESSFTIELQNRQVSFLLLMPNIPSRHRSVSPLAHRTCCCSWSTVQCPNRLHTQSLMRWNLALHSDSFRWKCFDHESRQTAIYEEWRTCSNDRHARSTLRRRLFREVYANVFICAYKAILLRMSAEFEDQWANGRLVSATNEYHQTRFLFLNFQ